MNNYFYKYNDLSLFVSRIRPMKVLLRPNKTKLTLNANACFGSVVCIDGRGYYETLSLLYARHSSLYLLLNFLRFIVRRQILKIHSKLFLISNISLFLYSNQRNLLFPEAGGFRMSKKIKRGGR